MAGFANRFGDDDLGPFLLKEKDFGWEILRNWEQLESVSSSWCWEQGSWSTVTSRWFRKGRGENQWTWHPLPNGRLPIRGLEGADYIAERSSWISPGALENQLQGPPPVPSRLGPLPSLGPVPENHPHEDNANTEIITIQAIFVFFIANSWLEEAMACLPGKRWFLSALRPQRNFRILKA